jgi:hypothetical protein
VTFANQKKMPSPFEPQLEMLVKEYTDLMSRSKYDDGSDIGETAIRDLQTRCFAAIQRAAGIDSIYYKKASEIGETNTHVYDHVAGQVGVVKSLLSDIRNGFLKSLEEIIHGDLFADFLEMAEHLTDNGYKDAAAVIAGSTLESHIRQLCAKFALPIAAGGKPIKADTLNADLVKASAYTKLDQKNVTAWFDLRNNAAHGHYTSYDAKQVSLMIAGIRDFITRHPA